MILVLDLEFRCVRDIYLCIIALAILPNAIDKLFS
jgi:hypothetical protein